MSQAQFVGIWKLVSLELRPADGEVTYPLGRDAAGVLMYDASGHVSIQFHALGRPAFASGDPLRGTPEEISAAYQGYFAYYGTYEVHEAEGTVTHHIEGSLFPNWIGEPHRRFYQFSNGRLTLSTPPYVVADEQVTGALVWERAG